MFIQKEVLVFGCWVVVVCCFCFEYVVINVQPFLGLLFINEEQKKVKLVTYLILLRHKQALVLAVTDRQNGSAQGRALGDIETFSFHRVKRWSGFIPFLINTCSDAF